MIDFDQNATTPVAEPVLDELVRVTREFPGNTSSGHSLGARAGAHLSACRERVAAVVNAAEPAEIVFTSGGTESDNQAVRGIARAVRKEEGRGHLVTSAVEHRAVLTPCEHLRDEDGFRLSVLPVGADGIVDPEEASREISPDTALVSVMLANNEIGTIQPVAELARFARTAGARIHSDGVQAVGKMPVDVRELDVDALSLSAHKFYGPKGVGLLYLRNGTPCEGFLLGGTHEGGRRAGTVPLPQISALTVALELAETKRVREGARLEALRNELVERVLARVPGARLNGDLSRATINTASIRFDGVLGGRLLQGLDRRGILASAGSACMWEITSPSHVLTALGLPDEEAAGTIRFSLGFGNTREEVADVVEALAALVPELRTVPAEP